MSDVTSQQEYLSIAKCDIDINTDTFPSCITPYQYINMPGIDARLTEMYTNVTLL